MATNKMVSTCMEMLVAEYGDRLAKQIDESMIGVWQAVLADVDDQALAGATVEWLRGCHPHPPRSGELRMMARQLRGDVVSEDQLEVEASEAWAKANAFIRGEWSPPLRRGRMDDERRLELFAEEHPKAAMAMSRLGRPASLGQISAGDAVRNLRPNFIRAYKSLQVTGESPASLAAGNEAVARLSQAAQNGSESLE